MITDFGNLINSAGMAKGVHGNTGRNPFAGCFIVTGIFSYTRMSLQETF
jgi:hypothetical protein